ncbi:hypothetical protein MF271_23455 (plasmid) [Deinococcus sp. KNUC1210]|uniref:hypothetical protein n=1 Tax=Deinococcus sp. KNUC1210 TaxID=2917691 RepID=UPI001EF15C4C|nr:hypothetical protein [Deinococcus sp. KNUC1210]ULH17928.1 hypothetical protein MF271_23455 [Deinococcus sp. KNUC1210]
MNSLHSLMSPFAALAKASERERALISALELAVLNRQDVTLPKVSGRKNARLLAAEKDALHRASEYARHLREREAGRPVMERPREYPFPCWRELPTVGELFIGEAGEPLECIDVLYENSGEHDDHTPHLLLVLPSYDQDDIDTNELTQTLDQLRRVPVVPGGRQTTRALQGECSDRRHQRSPAVVRR